jgi:hypothetical protein
MGCLLLGEIIAAVCLQSARDVVAAHGDGERRRRDGEYGAAEFITKPVDFPKTQLPRSVRRRGLTNPNAASNGRFQTIPGVHVKVGLGAL